MSVDIDKVPLEGPKKMFAISNTPSFLLRKLREDEGVRELTQRYSSQQILAALKRSAKKKPKTLEEIVRPYALLVALSWYSDISPLKKAAKIKPKYCSPWFDEIAHDLIARHNPIIYTDVIIPNRISAKSL